MPRQAFPASGQSTSTYNEHGELATEIDARGVVVNRTMDVLDRVTAVNYPDSTLNVTWTYDTGAFGKGRLTGIARHGETLAHTYDRFGRLLQDGTLTYESKEIHQAHHQQTEQQTDSAESSSHKSKYDLPSPLRTLPAQWIAGTALNYHG